MENTNNERHLKVYSSRLRYADNANAPCIRIEGKWLSEYGFNPGDYISVECKNGELIIRKDIDRIQHEADEIRKYKDQINSLSDKELSYLKEAIRQKE